MRLFVRAAVLGAVLFASPAAMAFTWPWTHPTITESHARWIAKQHGFASISYLNGTFDGDWRVLGKDHWGHHLNLVIDGKTGKIEHAEMDAHQWPW